MTKLECLARLNRSLHESIRGQDHVFPAIIECATIGESNLASPDRPKGSFMFLGPTGVGKTETARILAHALHDGQEPIRLDMAEFKAEDALVKFIGDHTGRLGRLGTILCQHHAGVLLFDEIEKARADVIDVFLAILDAARVTCGVDRTFDLSGFYIVFTSNLGAADILRAKHLNYTQIEKHVVAQVAYTFRPEFLGRIDSTLVFRKLTYEVQVEIARLHLQKERRHLTEQGHRITFHEDVLTFLLQVGFDKYLGARPLRKAMERHIRFPIAVASQSGAAEGLLRVGEAKDRLVFQSAANFLHRKLSKNDLLQ
jgi:ATP-dependent Clp protease ATP-binding subunit ClpA